MDFHQFLSIAFAGIIGTTVMILVMGIIHGLKLADADMVRAIGSIYTHKTERSFAVGLIIHYTAGILFALLYSLLIFFAPIPTGSPKTVFLVCLLAGVFHGLVVSMMLAVVVAEYHPLERFRNAGAGVVISHLIGHIFYGASVGLAFALAGLRFDFLF